VEDQISERGVWRSTFSLQIGVLSVMITLISILLMLSASSWGSLGLQQHIARHILEKEVVLSGLIILTVLALKVHRFTAHIMDLEFTTVGMMKMLVFSVHVSHAK